MPGVVDGTTCEEDCLIGLLERVVDVEVSHLQTQRHVVGLLHQFLPQDHLPQAVQTTSAGLFGLLLEMVVEEGRLDAF